MCIPCYIVLVLVRTFKQFLTKEKVMTENQIYGFVCFSFVCLVRVVFSTRKIEEKALSDKILCIVYCSHLEVAGFTSEASLRKALKGVNVSLFHEACEKLTNEGLLYMESVSMGENSRKILYEITDKGRKHVVDRKTKSDKLVNKTRLGEGLGM